MVSRKQAPTCRRVRQSLTAGIVFLIGTYAVGIQPDLAVSSITPGGSVGTGTSVTFQVNIATAGVSGVYVTTIFTPSVTFNVSGSTSGCAVVATGANDPTTTVTCPATGLANVQVNVTPKTVGTLNVVAGIIGSTNEQAMSNNALIATPVTVSGPSVTGILPKAGSANGFKSVTISGSNFESGATVTIGGTAATNVVIVNSTTITATTPTHASGASTVTVNNPAGGGSGSFNSYTFVSPSAFTDDPIIAGAGGTSVKATHVLQLRTSINNLQSIAGDTQTTWTNAVATGAIVYAVDVQEMRTPLNTVLGHLGYGSVTFTDNPLQGAPSGTTIKKIHIDDLRNGIKQVTN